MYINSQKKKDKQGIPPLKKGQEMVAESDSERAEELIGQFNGMFNKTEYKEVPLTGRSTSFMNCIVVSSKRVMKLLKGLNLSKALEPDGLHPRVLQELANELGPIFWGESPKNSFLQTFVPSKKVDRVLACNYRPVFLTRV